MVAVETQKMPSEVETVEGFDSDNGREVRARISMADGSTIEVSHVGVAFGLRITDAGGRTLEPIFGPLAATSIAEGLIQVCNEAAYDETSGVPN